MKERARTARRILEVQRQMHRLEEVKFAQLQQRMARLEKEQLELTQALSQDDALHGLFVDVTVRRIAALKAEANRLKPEWQARAEKLIEHGGRVRNAERLSDELDLELRRLAERAELEEVLEVGIVRTDASLKQDG
jgi:uncharacterized small protein (DUF1192 family)